ncbi:MAG: flagellar filament capping protein FliD [Planctomycetaceae bacterium]|nr:flagellar filament capping protein FliD [Planctomycetaceae bacterium]
MSSLQLPGLSTGLDTKTLVQQLMAVEKRRLSIYQNKIAAHKGQKSVIGGLQSKLSSLKSALRSLSDSSQLRSFAASTSDKDILTVGASANAFEGSHSIQIKQLATADRWVHSTGYKYDTSYVGAGTFLVSYNNQQLVVQTTAETTLNDLVNLINNDPENPGINAGLLQYDDGSGNGYHLVLNGRSSGSDYQITVDSSSAEVRTAASTLTSQTSNAGLQTKLTDLDDFSGQAIDFANLTQVTIQGAKHDGTAVNSIFTINRYATIEDLIGEIETAFGDSVKVTFEEGQLKVTDKTTGVSSMTLQLDFQTATQTAALSTAQTTAGGGINANIAALAGANFTETQSAQDSMIKVDGYPTAADQWISRSTNTIDDVIAGVTLNLQSTTANDSGGFDTVDINLTRDTKELKDKLKSMIEAYNAVVMFFDENTKYDDEAKKSGPLSSEYSLTSIRSLLKLPMMTNAVGFTSADSFDNAKDIGLTLDSDGLLELNESEFDEAVVDDYLGILSLLGAVKTGSTSGTDAAYVKYYGSSKSTAAGTFNIRVNADGSVLIKTANETWAQARQAVVKDNYIYGNSQLNPGGRPMYPEFDLQLSLDTTQLGRQMDVTVNIRQGVAGSLFEEMDDALKTGTGRVPIAIDSLDNRISSLEKQIEAEENRLTGVESRLVARFARLEKMLAMIQQQFSGISAIG